MAEEQAVGVTEQSSPSAPATQDAEAHNDALTAPPPPADDDDVAADEASVAGELDELVATASQRDEYLALAQRTQADFENYRKRVARDAAAAEARGVARLARELLPALDSLDRALAAAADADEGLIEGLRLVQRELLGALERVGVEPYGAAGEQFDPELHEAVAQQPFDGREPGEIVEVYQAGYRLAGGVIRPARVLVAG
jgi:molecular chaperone GrpE